MGLNLQLGVLRALEYPLLGDSSHLEVCPVRAGASSIGGWSINGLLHDWVVYGLVLAVPEISLSFAASLPGVLFQSVFEASGKLLRRFAPVGFLCGARVHVIDARA